MKKNLLATLLTLFVLFGIGTGNVFAQGPTPPASSCGYATQVPTVVAELCSDGSTTMPADPGTGAPNYAYFITSIPDTVILGVVEAGDVFDAAAMGLSEGTVVNVTGFGYDQSNILAIITAVGSSGLCPVVLDPVVCATLAGVTSADLNTLLELASTFNDGAPVTINGLLGLIGTVEGLGGILGAPAPCYSITAYLDYQATVIACATACEASVGTIVPPANLFACNDGSNAGDLAVAIPTDTNTSDYLFIVTGNGTDPNGDPLIQGVSYDGTFDFTGLPDGDYCYWGFAYSQTELDAMAAALNGLLPILSLPTIPIPADLGVIFDTFGGLIPDLTIPAIFGLLAEPPIPLPELCYAINDVADYCVTLGTCALPCEVDGGQLSTTDATTFCNDDVIEDYVTVTTTGGEGGELLINIVYDATKGTTGLVGSDKVYIHSGAGTSGPGSAWEAVIGNWGQDDGIGEMTEIADDMWAITVSAEYYGLAAGTTIYGIGMVFRNAAGNLEGKDYNNQDIYIREINTGSPVAQQADGSPFDGVFADLSSTVAYEYIVTDADGNVLFGPDPSATFDFNGAPAGVYFIYGIAYEGTILVGDNISDITGDCYDLSSNALIILVEECGVVCEANAGVMTPTGTTTICQDGIVSAICVDGNNTSPDFSTVFVATLPSLDIIGFAPVCEDLDLFEVPPGQYNLYCLNYATADEGAIVALVDGGGNLTDLIAIVNDGTVCADIAETSVTITIVEASDPFCSGYPGLVASDASTTIGGAQYVVVFTIVDGSGDYTISPEGTFDGTTYVSNPINCNTDASFTVTDNLSGQVVTVTAVSPCAVACEANYGDVAFGETTLCEGTNSDPVVASGDNTEGFSTYLVITQGVELTILEVVGQGSINFSAYAPGNYTVHAFNISDADFPTVAALLGGGTVTGGDVAQLIADGDICAELDVTGIAFTILDSTDPACQVTPTCDTNPIVIFLDPACDNVTGTVDLSVTVTGGFPDDTDGYYIAGTLFGTNTSEQGNPFVIPGLADQDAYLIIISDAAGCVTTIEGTTNCTKCPENTMGDMPADLVVACHNGSVASTLSSSTLEEGSFVGYALHTTETVSAANILAESTSGSFSFDFGGAYNTVYYITALAGNVDDNGNGVPDISNECTTRSATSTPVVFLSPVMITVGAPQCDNTTGLTTYAFSVSGGYPSFEPSATYTLSGEINSSGETYAGISYSTPQIGDATTWILTAADDYGCTSDTYSATTNCEKGNYVSWLSFTGKVQDNGNLLKWVTATEVDNDYFSLERSLDGINFTEIYRTEGAGTTTVTSSYQFLDQNAPSGISYYRVTQVDFDGQFSSTEIIALTRNRIAFGIGGVAPVPTSDFAQLTINADENKTLTVELYDVTGRMVSTQQADVNDGVNTVTMDVRSLPAGMYFVKVSDGNFSATERIVKQ
ncbi:MAG: T9SS type A sorting domain-containing protein [Sphingobacteriales bacterium]|nr:MAG: T9SS type A sorting domain-containing protein [Sphingobacteriales bacterium]